MEHGTGTVCNRMDGAALGLFHEDLPPVVTSASPQVKSSALILALQPLVGKVVLP